MTRDQDNDDKTVKELIDAATRAELERWFGLPSVQQVEEEEKREEDPAMLEVQKRRAKALEAIDPAMVEWHRRRVEVGDDLIKFKATIDVRVNPDVTLFDESMIEKQTLIAEPREVEIPEPLRDDLRDCTPQALLRDLHRPELSFDKAFEIVDTAAESRLDASAIVEELMTTAFRFTTQPASLAREGREILRELRGNRLHHWTPEALAKLANRRVSG